MFELKLCFFLAYCVLWPLYPTNFLGASREETRSSSYTTFFGRVPSRNAVVFLQKLFWGRTDKKRACLLTPSFLGASRQETRSSSYTNFFGPVPSRNAVVFLQKLFWGRTDKKRACILTLSFLGTSRQEASIFSTLAFEVASFKIHAPFIRHLLGALLKIRVSHDCFRRIQKYSC